MDFCCEIVGLVASSRDRCSVVGRVSAWFRNSSHPLIIGCLIQLAASHNPGYTRYAMPTDISIAVQSYIGQKRRWSLELGRVFDMFMQMASSSVSSRAYHWCAKQTSQSPAPVQFPIPWVQTADIESCWVQGSRTVAP
jgi:hypothetical protein